MNTPRITPALVAAIVLVHGPVRAQSLDSLATHAFEFAASQLAATVAEVDDPNDFPRSTLANGSWRLEDSGSWTSGFFPGCLWLMHERSPAGDWLDWATDWTAEMEGEKNDTGSHDVGFKIHCSFGNGYRLTGNAAYPAIIRQGATSLASRYNPVVGCTRSWNNRNFPVIIDNMMNLEILFWGASHGGNPVWYDMAVSHALRTRQDHVRADGSTYHMVDYNPSTGAIITKGTVQGYANESTWARGQAWAIYGFTMSYRWTLDPRFLETAQQVADYFVSNLPADHVPYWDFEAPNIPNEQKDTSAGAIACSGLFELSERVTDATARTRYAIAAREIMAALCSPPYLAEGSISSGILLHGVGNRPSNSEVDVSLIYGDYYFLEALLRYQSLVTSVPEVAPERHMGRVFPNPFLNSTSIGFRLQAAARVSLSVYDVRGARVRQLLDAWLPAGEHRATWDGTREDGSLVPASVYFANLVVDGVVESRRVARVE